MPVNSLAAGWLWALAMLDNKAKSQKKETSG